MERYGKWEGREGWSGRWEEDRDRARRWRDPEEERWRREGRPEEEQWRRESRPEIDPPWVERGPGRRWREGREGRGLVEWEDRGPLEWLGDRVREATGRPRAPKGYTRPDERIRDDVCERMARSGVDVTEVEVKVESGEVTLSGSVWSREEKWRLEQVADTVFGVEDVHNQLRITRPTGEHGVAARRDDPHAAH